MFNLFNTSRKFRGGENRKTEIQNEGVGGGGGGFLFMYLYTIITNGGQRGVGVLGCPSMPLPRPCLAILAALTALHPQCEEPSVSSC